MARIATLNFFTVFLVLLILFSGLVSAGSGRGAPLGNATLNATSSSVAGTDSVSFNFSFTVPTVANYSNLSVEFPSTFFIADSALLTNKTNLPEGCFLVGPDGSTTKSNGTGGMNISRKISCTADWSGENVNKTFFTWHIAGGGVRLQLLAETSIAVKVYLQTADSFGAVDGIDGPSTIPSFNTVAGAIYNVTVGVSQVNNGSRFVNVSGNVFNVTATAQDQFGNTNETGGFNFQQNDTGVLAYFSGLGGGNGTFFTLFNATKNGTATVNVSSNRNPSKWNDTGANFTVAANSIVGLNVTLNLSSVVAGTPVRLYALMFDRFGNLNFTGGFNYTFNLSGSPATLIDEPFVDFQYNGNGTMSLNVSSQLNGSAWNATGDNLTVTSASIVGVNVTYNATSLAAGNQLRLIATSFDRFGNLNFTGGSNFGLANSTASGVAYVGGNTTIAGVFNLTANGTFALNVSSALNGSAWNVSVFQNVTVGSDDIAFVNVTYNATSLVAGQRLNLTGTPMDRFGNLNFSGGLNFSLANNTLAGVSYVEGNSSLQGAFNFTRNGTFAFNVSARLNQSAWNVSVFQNVTVGSDYITGANLTYNLTSAVAGSQLKLTAVGFDRFGNMNNSGGFNYTPANSTVSGITYVGGNTTIGGVFNLTSNGTFAFNASSSLNGSAWNVSLFQNVTVSSDDVAFVNVTYNSTSIVAGQRINLTGLPFDRFGNLNFSGGLNFSLANNTLAGVSYVEGNSSLQGAFNFTRNGTFAFNVSARLNQSASNVSLFQNVTVASDYVAGVNLTYNLTSAVAGSQLKLTGVGFDRFGNMNNSGGFNYTPANGTVSGINYVSGNTTIAGVFNLTSNGTFAFNASSSLNGSAWNVSTGQNTTVTSDNIFGINTSLNATSLTAGDQLLVYAVGFDRFGNLNFSAGNFNYSGNASGVTQVGSNGSLTSVFNLTRNGTWSFNVSAPTALSVNPAWNATGTNFTVTSANIAYINMTTGNYPTYSNSTVSQSVNGTFNITAFAMDRFGNLNFSGGFNFQGNNHSAASYVSGNSTIYGVFNTSLTGTAALTVYSTRDPTITNNSLTLNSPVHPIISGVAVSAITISGATVSWNTQETANSIVEYGSNSTDTTQVAVHSVAVTGLLSGTSYTYRVHSCSAFNLCSFSSYGSFITNSPPPAPGGAAPAAPSGAPGTGAGAAASGSGEPEPSNETTPVVQPASNVSASQSQTESPPLAVGLPGSEVVAGIVQAAGNAVGGIVQGVGQTAAGLLEKVPGLAPLVEQAAENLPTVGEVTDSLSNAVASVAKGAVDLVSDAAIRLKELTSGTVESLANLLSPGKGGGGGASGVGAAGSTSSGPVQPSVEQGSGSLANAPVVVLRSVEQAKQAVSQTVEKLPSMYLYLAISALVVIVLAVLYRASRRRSRYSH